MSILKNLPLNQRSWNTPHIDGADGTPVASAETIFNAHSLIAVVNLHPDLVKALEALLPAASSQWAGTTDGEPKLQRAREIIAKAKAIR